MHEKLAALPVLLCLLAPSPLFGAEGSSCGAKPIPELYKETSPAVVFISSVGIDPFKITDRVTSSIGSGFFIDPKGLILTNSHVVYRRRAITATLDDGKTLPAKLLGADPILDLAVLKVPAPDAARPALNLGNSDKAQVGDEVFAIGNPLGLDQTLTRGIISGLNRLLPDTPTSRMLPFIQTDAAINPGNSGGPLLNRCGEVMGLITAILPDAQNLGFAIPINLAKKFVPQLIEHGRIIRPWLGFSGRVVDKGIKELLRAPLVDGYLVETIEPGSPAEKEGLRGGSFPLKVAGDEYLLGGDIVTHLNDQELSDPDKVPDLFNTLKVGDQVRLRIFREGEIKEMEFSLPERPILPGDLPPEDRRTLSPTHRSRFPRQLP